MPCWELFEVQTKDYRNEVLPPGITARITIEAGVTLGWERYAGSAGICIGIDRFGASAPDKVLREKFGFSADTVTARAKELIQASK
jgi:transketolase